MRRTRRQKRRAARRRRTTTLTPMFASDTPLAETLRAAIRRARAEMHSAAGEQALEGAAFLAERVGEIEVRNLLRAACRHPARSDLLLTLAQAHLGDASASDRA